MTLFLVSLATLFFSITLGGDGGGAATTWLSISLGLELIVSVIRLNFPNAHTLGG